MAKTEIVYIATADGLVVLSNPGGIGRWLRASHELRGETLAAVATDQTDAQLVLARGAQGWRSTDGGQTWQPDNTAPIADPVSSVQLSGRDPVLLRAAAAVERSSDGGSSWEPTSVDQPWAGEITCLATAAYQIDTCFAGTSGGQIAVSTNRGRSWQIIRAGLPPVAAVAVTRVI